MTTITRSSALAAVEAGAVMAPGLVACPPCAALTDVAALMSVHQVHAVVVDPGAPRLITARDVVRAVLAGSRNADEATAGEAPSMSPHDTPQAVAERMVGDHVAHVLVHERGDGQARGVVSSFDITAVLAGHEPPRRGSCAPRRRAPPSAAAGWTATPWPTSCNRGIITCPATAPLAEVAAALVERRAPHGDGRA